MQDSWACSSAWIECWTSNPMVKGSKPFGPASHKLLILKDDVVCMKDIEIKLASKDISPHNEISGIVIVNYPGLYDGVVINTQIIGSNELVVWHSYNGKKISKNVSRLFISKDVMPENNATFTASIEFEPKESHDVKFRASIIEQHKEVESDQLFATFST